MALELPSSSHSCPQVDPNDPSNVEDNAVYAIAKELESRHLSLDCDASEVASFLNWRLAQLDKEEEEKLRGPNLSGWGTLPDLILERVFSYLSVQQRYYASCTCKQWYLAFHFPKPWANFYMGDTTLCRRKFDYGEKSWRYMLDHYRAQQFISHVGHYLRALTLQPTCFYGLFAHYHFMNHISSFQERYADHPDSPQSCNFSMDSLRFTFFCDMANSPRGAASSSWNTSSYIIGTGGDILGSLKRLIGNLKTLRRLELIDLLLVPEDAIHLLDEACSALCTRLRTLTLINCTKDQFALLHPACFIGLRKLTISPQNLNDEVVDMLGNNCRNLKELHLVQSTYSQGYAEPVDPRAWFRVNHLFKVFLRTYCRKDQDPQLVWQERANVVSVIWDSPFTKFTTSSVVTVIDLYSLSLREFGHFGLPKFRSSRKFGNRIDIMLLTLCRKCLYLNTLYVRDRISTSTALLIVSMAPNLRYFYVRKNALLKKIDYMFHPNLFLDFNFTLWIKMNAKSESRTAVEIGRILGTPGWKPLTDKDFKLICSSCPAY